MTQPDLFTFTKEGIKYYEIASSITGNKIYGSIRFNGSDYSPKHDNVRLTKQILRVYEAMRDSQWRTLAEIESITGDGQASISAQLRNLRKDRFGAHEVNKRIRGERKHGLYEYQLRVNINK